MLVAGIVSAASHPLHHHLFLQPLEFLDACITELPVSHTQSVPVLSDLLHRTAVRTLFNLTCYQQYPQSSALPPPQEIKPKVLEGVGAPSILLLLSVTDAWIPAFMFESVSFACLRIS